MPRAAASIRGSLPRCLKTAAAPPVCLDLRVQLPVLELRRSDSKLTWLTDSTKINFVMQSQFTTPLSRKRSGIICPPGKPDSKPQAHENGNLTEIAFLEISFGRCANLLSKTSIMSPKSRR
jgi:hypothetical protein